MRSVAVTQAKAPADCARMYAGTSRRTIPLDLHMLRHPRFRRVGDTVHYRWACKATLPNDIARLTAHKIAFSDAFTILGSVPTPNTDSESPNCNPI